MVHIFSIQFTLSIHATRAFNKLTKLQDYPPFLFAVAAPAKT
jgi:hypothetical protein